MNKPDQGQKCAVGVCGKFYCKKCVDAKKVVMEEGVCPMHRCYICNGESEGDQPSETQKGPLLECLCCPKAVHYSCAIKKDIRYETGQRCWTTWQDQVQFNIFYCLSHIDINNLPKLELATTEMLEEWYRHLASQHLELKWSKSILEKWEKKLEERAFKEPQKVRSPAAERKQQECEAFRRLCDAGIEITQEDYNKAEKKIENLWKATKAQPVDVKEQIYKPEPYCRMDFRKMPPASTMAKYRQLVRNVIERDTVGTVLPIGQLREMERHYQYIRRTMEPFRHQSYTSYGRHFTKEALIKEVAQKVAFFLRQEDVVVDFSCGANEWLKETKRVAENRGIRVQGYAVDIITPEHLEDFCRKSWFEVKPSDDKKLQNSDKLVIGLNPPFGQDAKLASKWVQHGVRTFHPRVLALVVPPNTWFPNQEYETVFLDDELMRDHAFYRPGQAKSSHNLVTPVFKIMVRKGRQDM
eukprot:TRINITY_DN7699_c0_g1_i2.p1 TRINITY_DN7699_c0_g1~~TRINITY_DN7699_c0_g1_i2.p1  ORF type:complete len:475 (+),score=58.93 TRINITY_DN7699_c0_g1_i2:22-1425(+)